MEIKNPNPPIGTAVRFGSASPNEHRRSLNGRICKILSAVHNAHAGYPDSIAFELKFQDDQRVTWAAVDEFEVIKE